VFPGSLARGANPWARRQMSGIAQGTRNRPIDRRRLVSTFLCMYELVIMDLKVLGIVMYDA